MMCMVLISVSCSNTAQKMTDITTTIMSLYNLYIIDANKQMHAMFAILYNFCMHCMYTRQSCFCSELIKMAMGNNLTVKSDGIISIWLDYSF